jgi:hypothetical protein
VDIENDYRALDLASNKLKACIEVLIKIQAALKKDTDVLYEAGFQDVKFQELKTVLDDGDKNMSMIVKEVTVCISQLEERSQLIKSYYSVTQ